MAKRSEEDNKTPGPMSGNEELSGFRRDVNEILAITGFLRSVGWEFSTDVSGQPIFLLIDAKTLCEFWSAQHLFSINLYSIHSSFNS
jgi:hypothetical protein